MSRLRIMLSLATTYLHVSMETQCTFYRVYCRAFALFKKTSHTLMMTNMDYALHLTPVSVVHYTISLNSVGPNYL